MVNGIAMGLCGSMVAGTIISLCNLMVIDIVMVCMT